jgi:hypothetical protein
MKINPGTEVKWDSHFDSDSKIVMIYPEVIETLDDIEKNNFPKFNFNCDKY